MIVLVALGILLWFGQGAHIVATNKLCGAKPQPLIVIYLMVIFWPIMLIGIGLMFLVGSILAAMRV